jgi:hypothetical protein
MEDKKLSPIEVAEKKTLLNDKLTYEKIKADAEEHYIKLDTTKSLQELWEEAYSGSKKVDEQVAEEEIDEADFETQLAQARTEKGNKEKKGYKKYIKKADREKLANSESKSNEVVENFNGEKRDELSESDEIKKEVDKKDLFNS